MHRLGCITFIIFDSCPVISDSAAELLSEARVSSPGANDSELVVAKLRTLSKKKINRYA
jgi:hypothetical protein